MFKPHFLVAFSLASMALAAPLAQQSTSDVCYPNFSGRSVSILAPLGTLEWGAGTLQIGKPLQYQDPTEEVGEFRVEFSGAPDSSYYIKAANVPANNFFASQEPLPSTTIAWTTVSGSGPRWNITCSYCAPSDAWSTHGVFASGCTIGLTDSSLCARQDEYVSRKRAFGEIRQYPCGEVPPLEQWSFVLP